MTKKTFLHDEQVKLGAKMIEFAGWMMPVSYSSIIDEHKTVRENVGLFDVSHMGEVFVKGSDALPFLNKLVPQDVSRLTNLKAVYCQLLNKEGGIIDDLIIYKLEENDYLLIVNASRIDEDLNWMVRNSLGFNVSIDNQSHNYSLLAVQGPKASDLMDKMGLKKENQPEFFSIKRAELFNINLFVSRTGYTGEDGFEILVKNEFSELLWNYIIEAGKEFGLKPIGLGARDTLRLEAALHLYGNDMDEQTSPIEANLTWSVSKTKIDDYNGKETIQKHLQTGGDKKLVGLKMLDRAIARHGYEVFYNNENVGIITSGGVSPVLNENIALAYVKNITEICTGTVLQVMIRDKLYNAEVVKRPFILKKNKI
ncbi:MAG TPA: glycine cleavage system aminomethyltransferase GcvT [Candidatus Gastranaerophilaceae bacterium]|nr:glycine cleavage system aminomethyltransferase GcvT [Candidatus Gastranaerophilaceae bacterium]HPT42022.1 glycine cleavage system aminomethyltransferase GcvT [Candidatus Gastranaerophilaceae bacterium]